VITEVVNNEMLQVITEDKRNYNMWNKTSSYLQVTAICSERMMMVMMFQPRETLRFEIPACNMDGSSYVPAFRSVTMKFKEDMRA